MGQRDADLVEVVVAVAYAVAEPDHRRGVVLLVGQLAELAQLLVGRLQLVLDVRRADLEALDALLRPAQAGLVVERGPILEPGAQLLLVDVVRRSPISLPVSPSEVSASTAATDCRTDYDHGGCGDFVEVTPQPGPLHR